MGQGYEVSTMSVIWRKVWRDLWQNKFRTLLVVLSTALGVFALGFVYGASGALTARMTESHKASVFPHITLYTDLSLPGFKTWRSCAPPW